MTSLNEVLRADSATPHLVNSGTGGPLRTVIAYRGTDTGFNPFDSLDVQNGYFTGMGSPGDPQSIAALNFYNQISSTDGGPMPAPVPSAALLGRAADLR